MNEIVWFVLVVSTSTGLDSFSPPVPGASACNALLEAVVQGHTQADQSAVKDGDIQKPRIHISVQCVPVRTESLGKAKGW